MEKDESLMMGFVVVAGIIGVPISCFLFFVIGLGLFHLF
jgi:hypothetical protein